MAGRYEDEREWRERQQRERYDDRYDAFGLNDEGGRSGREDRSFERDRVFGERESGVSYNRPQPRSTRAGQGGQGWQDERYGGVSPAMQRGDYETGYRSNPRFSGENYTGGGRSYGGASHDQTARGGYGAGSRPYDREGHRFGSLEADQRWAREMRRPASGGTGGYDYERGYGDGGRDDGPDFEDRAREAGDFFRRTGRRISNWLGDVAGAGGYDEDRRRYEDFRGARGRGPKGYQRSDERIDEDIHHHLTDDHYVDASDINVAVSGGEVTLSGTVETREAKHRAERIVEDLSSVKHVQNNIRVQPASTGYGSYSASSAASSSFGGAQNTVAASTADQVKDVTDGNTSPSAQKRN